MGHEILKKNFLNPKCENHSLLEDQRKTGSAIQLAVVCQSLGKRPIDSKSHSYFKGHMKTTKENFARDSIYSYFILNL